MLLGAGGDGDGVVDGAGFRERGDEPGVAFLAGGEGVGGGGGGRGVGEGGEGCEAGEEEGGEHFGGLVGMVWVDGGVALGGVGIRIIDYEMVVEKLVLMLLL